MTEPRRFCCNCGNVCRTFQENGDIERSMCCEAPTEEECTTTQWMNDNDPLYMDRDEP